MHPNISKIVKNFIHLFIQPIINHAELEIWVDVVEKEISNYVDTTATELVLYVLEVHQRLHAFGLDCSYWNVIYTTQILFF